MLANYEIYKKSLLNKIIFLLSFNLQFYKKNCFSILEKNLSPWPCRPEPALTLFEYFIYFKVSRQHFSTIKTVNNIKLKCFLVQNNTFL